MDVLVLLCSKALGFCLLSAKVFLLLTKKKKKKKFPYPYVSIELLFCSMVHKEKKNPFFSCLKMIFD